MVKEIVLYNNIVYCTSIDNLVKNRLKSLQPGYGPVTLMKRPMRSRLWGGVRGRRGFRGQYI